ncbi:MAG: metal ABC transporter permease [Acetobacteraceae bacterium]|nr:metal ABC transporter permease [Acetobacteraceae bacterium]
MIQAFLLEPFALGFMRRALAGCLALSVAGPPLGVFLVLRRMSLMSDVLQHGILPGIAIGAAIAGFSLVAMGLGGMAAGLAVALLAGWLSRVTRGREDSQLAGVYLLALALGVILVSAQRGVDLSHLLFGNVLAVDDAALFAMAGVATITLPVLALIWRPLIMESMDPNFLAALGGKGGRWHLGFMALVVMCVVAGFTALGTLMSVGLMMLPAIAARHVSAGLGGQIRAAVGLAIFSSYAGLLLSYHADLPTGPAIILTAGACWSLLILAGPHDSLLQRLLHRPHYVR